MKKEQQHPASKGDHHPSKDKDNGPQPDPATLGTTDPQDHMEGPVSSLMQKAKEKAEENNSETPEDAASKG